MSIDAIQVQGNVMREGVVQLIRIADALERITLILHDINKKQGTVKVPQSLLDAVATSAGSTGTSGCGCATGSDTEQCDTERKPLQQPSLFASMPADDELLDSARCL